MVVRGRALLFTGRVGVRRVGVPPDTTGGESSAERMDERATFVCVGRGFLSGTNWNSEFRNRRDKRNTDEKGEESIRA